MPPNNKSCQENDKNELDDGFDLYAQNGSKTSTTSLDSIDSGVGDQQLTVLDVADSAPKQSPKDARAPLGILILVQLQWLILILFGFMRVIMIKIGWEKVAQTKERAEQKSFVSLYEVWEPLFTLYIVRRLRDILNRPIAGVPGGEVLLKDRVSHDYGWTFQYPGATTKVTNLGSYNYLGFAENDGQCASTSQQAIDEFGVGIGSSVHEYGNTTIHRVLEETVATFLHQESAICYPMGFGTNTMGLPALVDDRCLVLSDELNHASLILGLRLSGATAKVFKHNSPADCECQILNALSKGKNGVPFSKMLIIIEGLYSMEGTIPELPKFVELKKKYGAYLFMDEAHSIGSMGRTGRGTAEYWHVDHSDVDVLMGTFTKAMGAAGGYMAGKKKIIDSIRVHSHGCYAPTMSPAVAQQVITALRILSGSDWSTDGVERLAQLRINTQYFRRRLTSAGFMVIGNDNSPVVPVLIYGTCRVAEFGRQMLALNVGVVVVGTPATPIATERARFCLSSAHTREQLDHAIDCIMKVGDQIGMRFMPPTSMKEVQLVKRRIENGH